MKIIFVGGGTAGHINPALALADYIKNKEPNTEILYVGAKGGMEKDLVKKAGYKFEGITISGFSRKISFESIKKNIKTLKNILISSIESEKILKNFKPDICIGTGGYVSGPFLRKAGKLKIPFLIHDSNSYPGITTKLLAKKAEKVLIVNKEAKKHLPKNIQTEITGTPVRSKSSASTKEEACKKLNINSENPTILSFGGSLGSKAINTAFISLISKHFDNTNFNFIHGFGKMQKSFKKILSKEKIDINNPRLIIKEYIDNMPECMAAADLVICRAGATTLSELQSSQKPAILIPSPNVAENHQYHNAMALVNENAASIIEEKNLTGEKLFNEICKIFKNSGELAKKYSQNLKRIAITDSCKKIYKIIESIIKQKQGV
ncbi:MAG: undecaprenyldiphospho-muramoylpentapeptide beta-N-acetylglucosaminyltransferase [Clostridia bacterium]|nr:undecaprenyldiphospho-muramoylpentapeptide beta-N-acetylglucosaminyltransferase [Clostridia bacterium]